MTMDYDFRSAAGNPLMAAFGRFLGRGKKAYAEWLEKGLGKKVEAGDAFKEKFFDATHIMFHVDPGTGNGGRINLKVRPDMKNQGKYSVDVEYTINKGGRTIAYTRREGVDFEDFKTPAKVFEVQKLDQLKQLISGTYEYSEEMEYLKKSVIEAAEKTIQMADVAQEALFLAKQLKSPGDIDTLLEVAGKLPYVNERYLHQMADTIKNRQ